MTIKSDIETMLTEGVLGEHLKLFRLSTTTDDLGNAVGYSDKQISVTGLVKPLSEKARAQMPEGTSFQGAMIGYFLPLYSWFGADYEVSEGDKIIRNNSDAYRIEKIIKRPMAEGVVTHIKAFMRRIV